MILEEEGNKQKIYESQPTNLYHIKMPCAKKKNNWFWSVQYAKNEVSEKSQKEKKTLSGYIKNLCSLSGKHLK